MIDHGAKIKVIDVEGWYDAGEHGHAARDESHDAREGRARGVRRTIPAGVTIIDPVYIEDDVTLADVDDRSERVDRRGQPRRGLEAARHDHRHAARRSRSSTLSKSMIGDAAIVDGAKGRSTSAITPS